MLCVPSLPMFAYFLGAPGNYVLPSRQLLCEIAITEFTVMLFVCFARAAEFGVLDLFLRNRFWMQLEGGRLRSNKGNFNMPSNEKKTNIVKRGILTKISSFEVGFVLPLLCYRRMNEIDWSNSNALGSYHCNFATAMIIALPELKLDGAKRGRHGGVLAGVVFSKVTSRYV